MCGDGGYLPVFPARELPRMAKGKGVKLMALKEGEHIAHLAVLPPGAELVLHVGQKAYTLKAKDLDAYAGQRAQRGHKLPKAWQRVDALEARLPTAEGG